MYKKVFQLAGAFVTLLYTTIAILGQQSSSPPPPPPPPPAVDYFPDRWVEFVSPEGRFKAKFPKTPKLTAEEFKQGDIKATVHTIQYQGLFTCRVVYVEFPELTKDANLIKALFDEMRNNSLNEVQKYSPMVIDEKDISVDGYQGRFLDYQLSDKVRTRARWILAEKHLYEITAIAPIHSHAMESDNGYEKLSMSFLNSFHADKSSAQK